jgi:nucleotide-binding universal stress UspA family protein
MTYKTILVHLDAGLRTSARIDLALQLAAVHQAHVAALYTTFHLQAASFYMMAAAGAYYEQFDAHRISRRNAVKELFHTKARLAGVQSEWHEPPGPPNIEAPRYARHADLIVVGREDPDDADSAVAPLFLENLILGAGRPVLLAPPGTSSFDADSEIVLAWDGSRESTRAAHDALPLLKLAPNVSLIVVDAPDGERGPSRVPGADIATGLARHGVLVETVEVDKVPHRDIGKALIQHARNRKAGLIVAGAYGHSRILEVTLGGVTRTLMETSTVPVLFSH